MESKQKLLVSILELTKAAEKSGSAAMEYFIEENGNSFGIRNRLIEEFCEAGLIQLGDKKIVVSSNQRVKMAILAVQSGADIATVCKFLRWFEFENLTAEAFEANKFSVKKRFRFYHNQRRWEIDVLGCRKPIIACVDCKLWKHGWRKSSIIRSVNAQIARTNVFSKVFKSLQKEVDLLDWREATIIPVIVSLVEGPLKFFQNVPIVPVLKLQNFLNDLPSHSESLLHFSVRP